MLAEYAAGASSTSPQKEYGYRNGQLLITATGTVRENVVWTNPVNVVLSGNNLTKTAAAPYGPFAGASSTQTLTSGDGYFEFSVGEANKTRFIGLSNNDTDTNYGNMDFGFGIFNTGSLNVCENATCTMIGAYGAGYATGDLLRVAIEGGVVKYYRNGAAIYTSTVAPTYPLLVDTSLYSSTSTLTNVVFSQGAADINWLVPDHLGTPRLIVDKSGSLAGIKRHDYLPFGEELFDPQGGRAVTQGYVVNDGVRQKFTQKERDNESGLDYFNARYYSSTQGRFSSPDEFTGGPDELFAFAEGASANPTFYADLAEPQSLNKYQYAYNNPLSYVDPDGHVGSLPFNQIQGKKTLTERLKAGARQVGKMLVRTANGAASTLSENNGLGTMDADQNSVGRAIGHVLTACRLALK